MIYYVITVRPRLNLSLVLKILNLSLSHFCKWSGFQNYDLKARNNEFNWSKVSFNNLFNVLIPYKKLFYGLNMCVYIYIIWVSYLTYNFFG